MTVLLLPLVMATVVVVAGPVETNSDEVAELDELLGEEIAEDAGEEDGEEEEEEIDNDGTVFYAAAPKFGSFPGNLVQDDDTVKLQPPPAVSSRAASRSANCMCQCSSLTYVDYKGQIQGNCKSVDDSGARWCFVDPRYAQCIDLGKWNRHPSQSWSYEACATPELTSPACSQGIWTPGTGGGWTPGTGGGWAPGRSSGAPGGSIGVHGGQIWTPAGAPGSAVGAPAPNYPSVGLSNV